MCAVTLVVVSCLHQHASPGSTYGVETVHPRAFPMISTGTFTVTRTGPRVIPPAPSREMLPLPRWGALSALGCAEGDLRVVCSTPATSRPASARGQDSAEAAAAPRAPDSPSDTESRGAGRIRCSRAKCSGGRCGGGRWRQRGPAQAARAGGRPQHPLSSGRQSRSPTPRPAPCPLAAPGPSAPPIPPSPAAPSPPGTTP